MAPTPSTQQTTAEVVRAFIRSAPSGSAATQRIDELLMRLALRQR